MKGFLCFLHVNIRQYFGVSWGFQTVELTLLTAAFADWEEGCDKGFSQLIIFLNCQFGM